MDNEGIEGLLARAEKISNEVERSKKIRGIVSILAMKGGGTKETRFLDKALEILPRIKVPEDQSKALAEIACTMARIGADKKEEKTIRRALELAQSLEDELDVSLAYHEVIGALARIGVEDKKYLDQATSMVEKIPRPTYQSSAHRNLARMLIKRKDLQEARSHLSKSIEILEKSKVAREIYRSSALCDIASILSDLNEREETKKYLGLAYHSAQNIEDSFEKSSAFQSIAEMEARLGVRWKDNGLLGAAKEAHKKITREYYCTSTRQTINALLPERA